MKNRTPLLVLITAISLISGLFLYDQRHELLRKYSWYFQDEVNKPLEDFLDICDNGKVIKNAEDAITNLRHCVNINSVFSADKKHEALWRDRPAMMQWLRKYVQKETNIPPPMECFYRARTLTRGLKIAGYRAHTVVITSDADNFMDHVIVEVMNPDTNDWEIQDPLYDIKYISKKDGRALGVRELLTYKIDDFQPCDFNGKCGWDLVSREKFDVAKIKNYLSSGYDNSEKVLYLSRNFDENKIRDIYDKKMSFCQWKPEYCHKIVHLKSH